MLLKAKKIHLNAIKSLIDFGAKSSKILPRSKKELETVLDSFFVWEEKGKVIACCSLEVYSPKLAEIRSLIVLPKFQHQGIGKRLIVHILRRAKKLNVYEVLAITDRVPFFERVGFKTCLNDQYAMFVRP